MSHLPLRSRLLFSAAVTLGLALLAESVTRLLYTAELRAWRAPPATAHEGAPTLRGNPYLLFEYAPGVRYEQGVEVRINHLGLRGPDPVLPRPADTLRLMTTGDSSVFGFGVAEDAVFSSVAAAALGVEAINAAIPGYSTFQSINLLRLRALQTEPSLLVIGNLWSDNNFDSFVDRDLLATTTGYARSPLARLQKLLSASAVYQVADWKLRVKQQAQRIRTVSWQVGSSQHIGLRRVEINDYAANLEILTGMAHEVGAEVVFLLLANEEDVRSHVGGQKAWTPYRQVMRDTAARHGAPLIDVPALFQASGLGEEALFLDEMHPTAAGHNIIGQALTSLLQERRWTEGGAVETGGTGGPIPTYTDPFVHGSPAGPITGQPSPSGADGVRIQGTVALSETGKIHIEAVDVSTGAVLRGIVLDRPGSFVLQIGAARKVTLQASLDADGDGTAERELPLPAVIFDLDQGPAGTVLLDLDAGTLQ